MSRKKQKIYTFNILGQQLFSFEYRQIQCESSSEEKENLSEVLPSEDITKGEKVKPIFVINSLTLHECYRQLMTTEQENLHMITGSEIGSIRSLERIIPLSLSSQDLIGVTADNTSLANEMIRLYELGLKAYGFFHSHPGSGVNATYPSSTDRRTQTAMEESGGEIIGGIFSHDGYVRFYQNTDEPDVRVIGKQVQEIEKNVYFLEIKEGI
jgi:proteasome lid subunit RPN8/RPN11